MINWQRNAPILFFFDIFVVVPHLAAAVLKILPAAGTNTVSGLGRDGGRGVHLAPIAWCPVHSLGA